MLILIALIVVSSLFVAGEPSQQKQY